MKIHTELMQGDCIELLQNIKDESIDAVVTDPPYCYLNTKEKNCDFDKKFDNLAFVEQCKRVLKKNWFCCNVWKRRKLLQTQYSFL